MIELGLSKLAVIGAIALIVLGPERLPKVARTVGTLLGRAQRYIADVKSEVSREMDLEELRRFKTDVQSAAQSFEETVHTHLDDAGKAFNDPYGTNDSFDSPPHDAFQYGGHTSTTTRKRKNWRVRQTAAPLWYRKASRTRSRVQSGAARVARYRVGSAGSAGRAGRGFS